MTAPDSLPPIDDQLLSAYLDDELSDAERAEVEQRLEADAAARRLLAELRSLGATLQQLPVERPDPDLQATIKARIAAVQPTPAGEARHLRDHGGRRRWGWAATAIAAALLLGLMLPDEEQGELAGVDRQDERAKMPAQRPAAKPAAPEPADADAFADSRDAEPLLELTPEEPDEMAPEAEAPALARRSVGNREDAPASETLADRLEDAEGALALAGRGVPRATTGDGQPRARIPVVELTYASPEGTFVDFQRVLSANQVEIQDFEAAAPAQQAALQEQLRLSVAKADDPPPEEAVLIEADPAQVEQILLGFHQDRATFGKVAIRNVAGSGSGGRAAEDPGQSWRQYARGVDAPPAAAAVLADEQIAPRVAASRAQTQSTAPAPSPSQGASPPRPAAATASVPRGWALRLRPGSTPTPRFGFAEAQQGDDKTSDFEEHVEEDAAGGRIQVLFLLQDAAP